jgi:hypothetical protein
LALPVEWLSENITETTPNTMSKIRNDFVEAAFDKSDPALDMREAP